MAEVKITSVAGHQFLRCPNILTATTLVSNLEKINEKKLFLYVFKIITQNFFGLQYQSFQWLSTDRNY
jgi:hypothetical protein